MTRLETGGVQASTGRGHFSQIIVLTPFLSFGRQRHTEATEGGGYNLILLSTAFAQINESTLEDRI